MECIIYNHSNNVPNEVKDKSISAYLRQNGLQATEKAKDKENVKTHWSERRIGQLLKDASKNDTIVVYEAPELACSTSQILEICHLASLRNVHLHFVKYNLKLINDSDLVKTLDFIQLISRIESDFISKRTSEALERRRAAGLPLGRPKGRSNKSLKLDRHAEDIKKYLNLGISKASIAKLVSCHPQTLYDWLERNKDSLSEAANTKNSSD